MLKMIRAIKRAYWSNWLKKYDCKLASGLSSLGKHVELLLEEHVRLGRIKIDGNTHAFGAYTYMRSGGELYGSCEIGRFCSIGSNVIIGLEKNKHPTDWLTTSLFTSKIEKEYVLSQIAKPTRIGNDCWIGRDAVIMSGVTIGDGAVIGTRALVAYDVPPYAIFAGVPAKLIKYRFSDELIEHISKTRWWDIEVKYLEKLNLENLESCIDAIRVLGYDAKAAYQKVRITKNGARAF